jgi:ESCRT-II complex subunit VPS22
MFHDVLDPLTSNKGFWADILGVGDFYFELGIVITQICLQTRSINGGIISLPNLLERVKTHRNKNKLKKQEEVSIEDLKRAIDKLSVLGSGFKLVESKGKIPYLLSVPIELNRDHEEIIEVAEEIGYVSSEVMSRERGWTAERFNHTINPLLLEGLVWEDNYLGNVETIL